MTSSAPRFRQVSAQPIVASDEELLRLSGELGMPTLKPVEQAAEPPAPAVENIPEHVSETAAAASKAPVASRSRAQKTPKAPAIEPTDASEKITIDIPAYVAEQVRRRAFEERSSARYVVLLGLKKLGIEVDSADLVPNFRRTRSR
jgi:hypothetical protein